MHGADQAGTAGNLVTSSIERVSGRYEGDMTQPQPGQFLLDLRVDIDSATAHSLPMNRISGDLYQLSKVTLPGQPPRIARTYLESWIVDRPQVQHMPAHIDIVGTVRFWTGTHAATTMALRLSRHTAHMTHMATVTFTEAHGTERAFVCRRNSDCFRSLELEIAACASVNRAPIIPAYDTHWHDDRPIDMPQRSLSIESAYREAGVEVAIDPTQRIIDDSAPEFESWSPAELHDAMETHFSRFGDAWPRWAMWGLLAGQFESPTVGGIMFDAAAAFGGAGKGPERQGFAVFRNHSWFDNLVAGAPQNADQAWAIRHFLYTWVHEAGHAFNFLHSWDKGRPDSLSWMNYDWRYEQRNGPDTYWNRFAFRFDDEELIHIRHGNRAAVIMGGDPWSSGSHLEAPNLAMAQIEGTPPIELLIRSKGYFDFMEPVIVELRLRNLLPDIPAVVDKRMAPEYGGVVVYIQKPDGHIATYEPNMCVLGTPQTRTLAPAFGAQTGNDRYSREIFLSYGVNGFYFDRPGEYRIRAVYQGFGDVLIPSNTHRVRIAIPPSTEVDRMAQDYFSDEVGLSLYLQGSRSPYLKKGIDLLEEVADRFKHSTLGASVAVALAHGLSRPFHRLADDGQTLKCTASADPAEALKLTKPALEVLKQKGKDDHHLNLAYARVVRRRAEYHQTAGTVEQAKSELKTLHDDLAKRGVNQPVLEMYAAMAASVGSETERTRPLRRVAAKRSAKRAIAKRRTAQRKARR